MSTKKIGDRVKSRDIEGIIINLDGREMSDGTFIPEWALVKQDDGITEWWSL